MTDHPDMTPSERKLFWSTPDGGLDPLSLTALKTLHVARLMELGLLESRHGRLMLTSPREQRQRGTDLREASAKLA